MKLTVRHLYPCSPEHYWEMYWNEAFDAKLQENTTVQRDVTEESEADGLLTRRLRFTPDAELPGPVAKLIGSKKLIWEQVNVFDRAKSQLTWEVLPTFLSSDKFVARGVEKVVLHAEGCSHEVDGNIDVKIRFIGGRIEAQVVSQIEDAYTNMDRVCREWLGTQGASS